MRTTVLLLSLLLVGLSTGEDSVSVQTKTGFIVDIKESVNNGAKLLGGVSVKTSEACVQQCKDGATCDMAVYKMEGLSESGRNCYLVSCVDKANCITAEHEGFVTSFLTKTKKQSVASDKEDDLKNAFKEEYSSKKDNGEKSSSKQDLKDVPYDPHTQESGEEHTVSKTVEKVEKSGKQDSKEVPYDPHSQESGEVHTVSKTVEEGDKKVEEGDKKVEEGDKTNKQDSKDVQEPDKTHSTSDGSDDAIIQETLKNLQKEFTDMGGTKGDDDDVIGIQEVDDKAGGSSKSAAAPVTSTSTAGIVVGVVIGGCFFVLLVSTVMAIGMRKGWDVYKKRKYKKMDYLINGMYS